MRTGIVPFDEAGARAYFNRNAKSLNPIEGIWRDADNTYTLAIVASRTSTHQSAGVVLKADGVYWQPGQVRMEGSAADSMAYRGLKFMRDHSPATYYAEIS